MVILQAYSSFHLFFAFGGGGQLLMFFVASLKTVCLSLVIRHINSCNESNMFFFAVHF